MFAMSHPRGGHTFFRKTVRYLRFLLDEHIIVLIQNTSRWFTESI